MPSQKSIQDYIRTIPDFPHEGIMFRDVTTLFQDPRGFRLAVDQLLAPFVGERIDMVVGLEARGFILGGAVAHQLSKGFVPIRKQGKLPAATIAQDYTLEYGRATVEIHDDALAPGQKVLLVDDLLATAARPRRVSGWSKPWVPRSWAAPSSSTCPNWADARGSRRWACLSTRFAPSTAIRPTAGMTEITLFWGAVQR